VTSANVVLLNSFSALPEQNYNFFEKPIFNAFTASADGPVELMITNKFCQADVCLSKVGISHLTTHDQDGNEVLSPVFPFKLGLEKAEISFPSARPSDLQSFMNQFKAIPVGSKLYTLRTFSSPEDTEGSVLGHLVTEDVCTTSKFGDSEFFIRHRPMEDDRVLKPEWAEAYNEGCGLENCIF